MHFTIIHFELLTLPFRLEEKRKVKGAAYYARKKEATRQLAQAKKEAKVNEKVKSELAQYGY